MRVHPGERIDSSFTRDSRGTEAHVATIVHIPVGSAIETGCGRWALVLSNGTNIKAARLGAKDEGWLGELLT
jgi:hypothetical protein